MGFLTAAIVIRLKSGRNRLWAGGCGVEDSDSDGDWRRGPGQNRRQGSASSLVSSYRHCKPAGERWMPRYKIWLPLYFLWELSQLLNLSELLSTKLRRVLLPRVVVRTK